MTTDPHPEGASQTILLGDWLLDAGSQRLRRDGESHILNPKEMDVLLRLVSAAPDLVTTEALLQGTWSDVVVGDHVVHEVIGRLRKVLGDSARHPRYIETLHKRGYRLIVPVEHGVPDADQPGRRADNRSDVSAPDGGSRTQRLRWWAAAAVAGVVVIAAASVLILVSPSRESASQATTLTVLPFDDLSPSMDQQWLANSMAEALVLYLSRIDAFQVVQAPMSLESFNDVREIGDLLGVQAVITGSVQRTENQLRVTAQLNRAADGSQLWSAHYDREFDDVFELQHGIAVAIVRAIETELNVRLPPEAELAFDEARFGTSDARAYELWRRALLLKIVYRSNASPEIPGPRAFSLDEHPPRDELLSRALEYNLEAVAIDPEFAQGFIGLSDTYRLIWYKTRDESARLASWIAIDRAVAVDAGNLYAVGLRVKYAGHEHRWQDAILFAEQIRPQVLLAEVDDAFALYILSLINVGELKQAQDALNQVVASVGNRPRHFSAQRPIHAALVKALMWRRDYHAALERLRELLIADPSWISVFSDDFAYVFHATGHEQEAVDMLLLKIPEDRWLDVRRSYVGDGWLGALRATIEAHPKVSGECFDGAEWMYAELADARMYDCLERVLSANWMVDSFDPYRDEPRFQAALDRMNITGHYLGTPLMRVAPRATSG